MARSDGAYNTAEGNASIATGGPSHAEGSGCTASGLNAHAEGLGSIASGASSHAGGKSSSASRLAQFSRASGDISQVGDTQFGQVYMMLETVDANPHNLLIGGSGGTLFVLENNKSYCYHILVIARSSTAGASSAWEIVGGIKRVSGVTSAIGAPPAPVNLCNDGGASAVWTAAATATAGTNSLDIVVTTGGAPQTVNWMSVVSWVETLLTPA